MLFIKTFVGTADVTSNWKLKHQYSIPNLVGQYMDGTKCCSTDRGRSKPSKPGNNILQRYTEITFTDYANETYLML